MVDLEGRSGAVAARTSAPYSGRNAPLQCVRGLFNVNHYIVSQARPYLVPFLQSDMHGPAAAAGGRHDPLATTRAWLTRMLGAGGVGRRWHRNGWDLG